MAACRLCGIDTAGEEDSLCLECQRGYGKKSIRQIFIKDSLKNKLIVLFAVALLFATLIVIFQAGAYLEAQALQDVSATLDSRTDLASDSAVVKLNAELAFDITAETDLVPITSKSEYVSWMTKNTGEERHFLEQRWDLSRVFVNSGELEGDAVIRAFLRTPREHFVRAANLKRAYDDSWLPIGYGATITDPDVVSMMTTSLEVRPEHRVLEIGTGSGYQSAFLAQLSNFVFTIEIIRPLAIETDQLYKSLEDQYPMYRNIRRKLDDGFYGWEQYAPFDRIIITCAIDHVPPPLIKQLAVDGIIVAPLGPPGRQQIMQMRKLKSENNKITITRRDVYNGLGVRFIPFTDKTGQSYYDKQEE